MITLTPEAEFPHWPPAETGVLSIFMQNITAMDDASNLTEDHFHRPTNKIVFTALRVLRDRMEGDDIMAQLIHHLHQKGDLGHTVGQGDLTHIFTYNPAKSGLERQVKLLNLFLSRRMAIKAALELAEAAFTCGEDIEAVLAAAGEPITAIHETVTSGKPPLTREILVDRRIQAFKLRTEGKISPMGIPSIGEIDNCIRGLHPGRIIVIGGYPEGGKSVLASQIVTDVAMEGTPSAFFSMEMPEDDVMDRCIIQTSRVDAEAFMDPVAYAEKHDVAVKNVEIIRALKRATTNIKEAPLHIVRPANRHLRTLIACIRRAHRDHGIKVAAVDYIQLITPSSNHRSEEAGIAEISHAFQELAQELKITILILTQLNQDGETKRGRVIEEDADAVLQIVQDRDKDSETYKQHQYILLTKDRHNGKGGTKIPLILCRETVRFKYGMPEKPAATQAKRKR